MRVTVDRSSVAAGDDGESHLVELEVDPALTLGMLVTRLRPTATIGSGRATWLVRIASRIVGVHAQEWGETRLFADPALRIDTLSDDRGRLAVFFEYLAQVDPEIALARYRTGGTLSSDERRQLTADGLAAGVEADAIRDQAASMERYAGAEAIALLEDFGLVVRVHSARYLRGDVPTGDGRATIVIQAYDSMAGVSWNGCHLANLRPLRHAEQLAVTLVGAAWREEARRPPAVLPAPVAGWGATPRGDRWFAHWVEGAVRHDATFGTEADLATAFGRYSTLSLSELAAIYRA